MDVEDDLTSLLVRGRPCQIDDRIVAEGRGCVRNMRQHQNKNRSRGRGRKPGSQANRTFDSNGPDVKIRGSASHIYEKYQVLSRDANAAGDRIGAENYLQHAEHYFRLMAVAQAAQQSREQQNQPRQKQNGSDDAPAEGGEAAANPAVAEAPAETSGPSAEASEPTPVSQESGDTVAPSTDGEASGNGDAASKPARKRRPRRPRVEAEKPAAAAEDSTVTDDAPAG